MYSCSILMVRSLDIFIAMSCTRKSSWIGAHDRSEGSIQNVLFQETEVYNSKGTPHCSSRTSALSNRACSYVFKKILSKHIFSSI